MPISRLRQLGLLKISGAPLWRYGMSILRIVQINNELNESFINRKGRKEVQNLIIF